MSTVSLAGLASSFDWSSFIDQMAAVERAPQTRLRKEQQTLQYENNAFGTLSTQLGVFGNRVTTLASTEIFDSRSASSSSTSVATATAGTGAALGTYKFTISQLATAATQKGNSDVGKRLSETDNVDSLVLSDAGFATDVSAGTFTVNGKQITIATSDTLQGVFDKIADATDNAVTASYNAENDTISLSSSSTIVLGSATDSSNFLQVTKLNKFATVDGTSTVTSSGKLGAVKSSKTLDQANFAQSISGEGSFSINGVSIDYNASEDSISNIMDRINNSAAGVTVSYDPANDRFTMTNKTTGDIGFSLEDTSGNFLAATGLSGGTLERGKNLLYSINDGGELVSQSNTIYEASSGISGVTVNALSEGTTTIKVGVDTATIRSAITSFITEYNSTQSYINSQTASSTDSKGVVSAGILASSSDANDINSTLRENMTSDIAGLSGIIARLDDLGFTSNGNDDSLTLSDSSKLDTALTNNLAAVKDFFTNSSSGLAVKMQTYLTKVNGDSGTISAHQAVLTAQSTSIDTQIADMEKLVQASSDALKERFVAMETAQQKLNAQLTYLQKTFK